MRHIFIPVNKQKIKATLFYPENMKEKNPAVLFIHGWATGEKNYVKRAEGVAAKGAICLTIALRGHENSDGKLDEFSRADHLNDVITAYDFLASQVVVDKTKIGICGVSYGGYLASLLTTKRPVKWLVLKSAALYKDENFQIPTAKVIEIDGSAFSQSNLQVKNNLALNAVSKFKGDILLIESENDTVVTHDTTINYIEILKNRKFTYKLMHGADHILSTPEWKQEFIDIVSNWFAEKFS